MKTFFDLVAQEDTLLVLDTSGNIIKEIPLDEFSEEIRESFNRIPTKIGYFENDKLIPIRTPLMHCHTDGSQLDGAVTAKQLAKAADSVVAITDHGVMTETYGFYNACKSNGKIPVIGCEVYTENLIDGEKKANHMVLLCKNLQGYRNICEILSRAEMNFYRRPQVSLEMLEELHDGLIATSACMGGEIPRALMDGNLDRAEEVIDILQDIFGDDFYLEVQRHNVPGEDFVNRTLIDWAQSKGIGIIATPDSHYAREEDRLAHEVLLGIGTHKTLSDEKRFKFEGDNYHIPTAEEFEELWADVPLVWEGLYDICKKIDFDFVTGKLFMPNFPCPEGMTQDDYFCHLVDDGFKKRFPSFDSPEKEEEYETRLAYEKETILKMGFSGYFLIVQDYIAYARSIGGFVGPGRGSAVGSLAAYCLGITNLDPIPYGLLFERERLRSLNPVN